MRRQNAGRDGEKVPASPSSIRTLDAAGPVSQGPSKSNNTPVDMDDSIGTCKSSTHAEPAIPIVLRGGRSSYIAASSRTSKVKTLSNAARQHGHRIALSGVAHQQHVDGNCFVPDCLVDPDMLDLLRASRRRMCKSMSSCRSDSRTINQSSGSDETCKSWSGNGLVQTSLGHGSSGDTDGDDGQPCWLNDESTDVESFKWKLHAVRCTTPPVTTDNLKELELPAIQNTLSLRIDLCFDHDLFFQRISGAKGAEKRTKAKIYYQCLTLELQAVVHVLQGSCSRCVDGKEFRQSVMPSRLSEFFSTLRDLLGLLVPEDEKQDVMDKVDVELLTRQVRAGVFDAVSFFSWLCDLITSHCAPMRDEMAQAMREKAIAGATTNDIPLLVEGLETLLDLLENMKIDVANHQVRSFKLLLIADTIPFLKDCFSKMIESRQFDVLPSKQWFTSLRRHKELQDESPFTTLTNSLVQLCCNPDQSIPDTFNYDKDRLQILRNDILDCVQLQICSEAFTKLFKAQYDRPPSHGELRSLQIRLIQLITSDDGIVEGVEQHRHNIALELARAVAGVELDSTNTGQIDLVKIDTGNAAKMLRDCLRQSHAQQLNTTMQEIRRRTSFYTERFSNLPDTLTISNNQRAWSIQRCEQGLASTPDIEDISRRLAHIAVIHWQVWADLVYHDTEQVCEVDHSSNLPLASNCRVEAELPDQSWSKDARALDVRF